LRVPRCRYTTAFRHFDTSRSSLLAPRSASARIVEDRLDDESWILGMASPEDRLPGGDDTL
jgi:hypothetical protein